jgi:hypothetical protein
MYIKQYDKLAEALLFAHGENAQREATRMADLHEKTGHVREAQQWRQAVQAVAHVKTEFCRAA